MPEGPGTLAIAGATGASGDTERALRERERARRETRRRRRAAGRAFAIVLGVVGVVWVGWFSSVFALDASRVTVVGADQTGSLVDVAAVRASVDAYVGTPLPRLDLGAMALAVSDVPGVRSATVVRRWPDGVRVAVVPRIPVAAVPGAGGQYSLVDGDGVAVGQPVTDPGALPVVNVPVGEKYARTLDAVVAVLDGLPTELAQRVTGVGAQTEDTIQMTLGDGRTLVWGGVEDAALKAKVALTLLDSPTVKATVIDVSAPTVPVTHD